MAGRSPRESSNSAWSRPSPTGGRPRPRSWARSGRPASCSFMNSSCAEYGYNGSYKSVRKFVRARYGRPHTHGLYGIGLENEAGRPYP